MITVIIPSRNGNISKNIDLENHPLVDDIVVVRGSNPSAQRNLAIRESQSSYLYFLDDDSIVLKETLKQIEDHIRKGHSVVGGPAIIKETGKVSKVFALVFSSLFAFWKARSRYSDNGNERETTEQEIILCNLLVKRSIFEQYSYFNEDLYPGEENELLKRLENEKILYDPKFKIYRSISNNFTYVLKKIYLYGKGRGGHINFRKFKEYVYLIPLLFMISLLASFFYNSLSVLLLYLIVGTIFSFIHLLKSRDISYLPSVVIATLFVHVAYALGILHGLLLRCFKTSVVRLSGSLE